jgi:hypothetical protein
MAVNASPANEANKIFLKNISAVLLFSVAMSAKSRGRRNFFSSSLDAATRAMAQLKA